MACWTVRKDAFHVLFVRSLVRQCPIGASFHQCFSHNFQATATRVNDCTRNFMNAVRAYVSLTHVAAGTRCRGVLVNAFVSMREAFVVVWNVFRKCQLRGVVVFIEDGGYSSERKAFLRLVSRSCKSQSWLHRPNCSHDF